MFEFVEFDFDFVSIIGTLTDTVSIVLVSVLAGCLIVQLLYYWLFLAKPNRRIRAVKRVKKRVEEAQPPVSVIVCAKNQAQSLREYMPILLEQNYPIYEVIFVDDDSSDETSEVIGSLSQRYPQLYHTYVPAETMSLSRRKLGLTIGIKAAKYDTLLFTDACCAPNSPDWISKMSRHFKTLDTVVLGFSTLDSHSKSYMVYDYYFSNLKMATMALLGRSYMANGKNLAYSKERFLKERGFSNSNIMDSGEDDLFVDEIAPKCNLAVELSPESVVTASLNEYQTWRDMKNNRVMTGAYYKWGPKVFWAVESWTRIGFYASLIASAIWVLVVTESAYSSEWFVLFGATALLRLLTQWLVINRTASVLGLPKFYLSLPLFDIIQPFVDEYFLFYQRIRGRKSYRKS
ncbi:glycosyltransferase [Candidatus Symbiothrix dinenymphae]|uniref:glycosyltransferase n=1 Tax=Candidatus Symbiothrix dinenymphae TaxID=467085 RepID=UPI0006C5E4FB|nr:glycosyltransferase [Candidatus Symbiothrix dinenymphae]GAP73195.1 glycosyl transferase family [Candidatus Symbiothrix dinenymphae]